MSKSPTRRTFLQTASAGLLLGPTAALWGCGKEAAKPATDSKPGQTGGPAVPRIGVKPIAVLPRRGVVIGGGKGKHAKTGELSYWLAVADLKGWPQAQVRRIPMTFFPHGLAVNPSRPHRAMVFEKHGKGCCEVDLRAGSVLHTVATAEDNKFYGHGAFSENSSHFFASETVVGGGSYRGLLLVRDSKSREVLGSMPTGGKEPHDCIIINKGRTLVVTNGGGALSAGGHASVTYVNPRTKTVEHTLRFTSDRINAGHIWLTSKGHLAIVSAPRDGLDPDDPTVHGALSLFSPGDKQPRTIDDPILGQMRGETLSVVIHEPSMVVGVTSPLGDLVAFFDFQSGKLLKAIPSLKRPRGIALTLDGEHFIVTHGDNPALVLIDVKTLEPLAQAKPTRPMITGSHILCHDLVG